MLSSVVKGRRRCDPSFDDPEQGELGIPEHVGVQESKEAAEELTHRQIAAADAEEMLTFVPGRTAPDRGSNIGRAGASGIHGGEVGETVGDVVCNVCDVEIGRSESTTMRETTTVRRMVVLRKHQNRRHFGRAFPSISSPSSSNSTSSSSPSSTSAKTSSS
mmetsp:Transcript_5655/g.13784  ORF Transcript_5655/g.13784 Transcript_5655/m.13784 type:complete len:161 (+) Transcript_5655:104-586(+)